MAVSTLTASSQNATPKAFHGGLTTARFTFTLNAAASTTASDVILLCKLPNKATVIDGYITGTCGSSAHLIKVGTSADDDAFIVGAGAGTLSATAARKQFDSGVMPFRVSLSDDAVPQWTWLKAETVSVGSTTMTLSITGVVIYEMGQDI